MLKIRKFLSGLLIWLAARVHGEEELDLSEIEWVDEDEHEDEDEDEETTLPSVILSPLDDRPPLWIQTQTPDVIRKMGWAPLLYNLQSTVRITMELNPEVASGRVIALVDMRGGPAQSFRADSFPQAASECMRLVDLLEQGLVAYSEDE